MLDLVFHNRTKERRFTAAFFRRVADAAEPYLKLPRGATGEIGIILLGPTAMQTLNRARRRKDKPTDVLAFPLRTPKIKGYTAVTLGDLAICPAVVRAKAREHENTYVKQMQWTAVHGLLHLAGYDHEKSKAAARRMAAVEQKILTKLG